jgi:hypothetical protein
LKKESPGSKGRFNSTRWIRKIIYSSAISHSRISVPATTKKAVDLARDAIRRRPDFDEAHVLLASALGQLDLVDEAVGAIRHVQGEASEFVESRTFWARVTKECVLDGLRKAGLLD